MSEESAKTIETEYGMRIKMGGYFGFSPWTVIVDAKTKGNAMRFINHDPKESNVDFITRVIDIPDGLFPVVAVVATKPILPNTAINVHYYAGEVGR